MKSLSETQPDFGFASAPVEVQRYVDGRLQEPEPGVLEVVEDVETLVVAVVVRVELAEGPPPPVQGRH